MKAADIERRREMWEAHAFEEFISDLISPDRSGKLDEKIPHFVLASLIMNLQFDEQLCLGQFPCNPVLTFWLCSDLKAGHFYHILSIQGVK